MQKSVARRVLRLAVAFLLLLGADGLSQAQFGGFPPGMFQSRSDPAAAVVGCSQATTFLARTSGLDATHQNAYTVFICGGVTDGWITGDLSTTGCGSFFDVIYIFATADTTTALLNICSTSFSGTANGSPTFTADRGYAGVDASTTVFIDTGFNPTSGTPNYTQNSAHLSVWSNSSAASTASGGFAAGNDIVLDGATHIIPRYSDDNAYFRVDDPIVGRSGGTANTDATGFYLGNRSGASLSQGYKNGALFATLNSTSQVPVGRNFYGLASNGGGGANFGSALQITSLSIGSSLTTQQANYYSRLRSFMTAVGVP